MKKTRESKIVSSIAVFCACYLLIWSVLFPRFNGVRFEEETTAVNSSEQITKKDTGTNYEVRFKIFEILNKIK